VKTAAGAYEPAFNNYKVWYTEHSANTTASNSKGWEYVYPELNQYIKYWDYSCLSYMFWAVADASKASFAYDKATGKITATINLSNSDANGAFIATPMVVPQKNYNKPVTLKFRNAYAQVRVGFYETIPGYVVKDVKFYASTAADATSSTDATILGLFPSSNTLSLSYDVNNPTVETLTYGTPTTSTDPIVLGELTYASDVTEKILSAGSYLNQTSSLPTYAPVKNAVPGAGGAITIKCDYTLVGTDFANEADNERIHVKGATAVVPADYCNWQAGYTYTYVFKITRNTNGSTGTLDGLYPINFDAVTTVDEQQTVTILEENYITTYQKGSDVTDHLGYNAGTIYVTVGDGTTAFDTTKATLYELTLTDNTKDYVSVSAIQSALNTTAVNGVYKGTGFTITNNNTPALTAVTSIPADATVDGIERNVKAASFTAVAGIYVLRYDVDTNKVAYKVIKVKTE